VGYAEDYIHAVKLDATNVAQYRTRVTVAGLVMSDGKNLEGNGVMPDERILPSAVDLASGRDPVLARALELTGSRVTPDEAGRILPYVWPKQKMPEID
jgi:C-terminal processing protease CtpA/Prc